MAEDVGSTLANDDARSGDPSSASLPHLFRVIVGQAPLAGGARHRLDGVREVAIGRAAALDVERAGERLVLGIPDARMSSRHVRISRAQAGWIVEDAGSTNGTFVDGERVTRASLRDGATVLAGSTAFRFAASLLCDASAPPDIEADALADRALGLATLVPSHAAALDALRRVAPAALSVLLLGPTGAGKEVHARAVHALSRRAGAFVPVNCGALPETLVESQLFGHVKGAFSGAARDEIGLVRASDRGTLFLDEIGDMPRPSQVALLRVLQEREVVPVGGTKAVTVDLRVVAATHRPVDSLEGGGFRTDLFARLAGYTHRLPSLAERAVDLGILVADILQKKSASAVVLTPALVEAFVKYPWPMNVRELDQALSVAVLLAKDGAVDLAHAPEAIRAPAAPPERPAKDVDLDSDEAKLREELAAKLREHAGNVTYVARDMGRTRMQIHRWMRRFGLDPESFRR